MNPIVTIQQVKDWVGQPVRLRGWLYNKRSSGKIQFLQGSMAQASSSV